MNEELLKSLSEANRKTVLGLQELINKQRKEMKTTISNLCTCCGYAGSRYLSPCPGCKYHKLSMALKEFK